MAKKKMNEVQRKQRLKELRSELGELYKKRAMFDDKGARVQGQLKTPNNKDAARINEIAAEIAYLQRYDDRVVIHEEEG